MESPIARIERDHFSRRPSVNSMDPARRAYSAPSKWPPMLWPAGGNVTSRIISAGTSLGASGAPVGAGASDRSEEVAGGGERWPAHAPASSSAAQRAPLRIIDANMQFSG